MCPGSAGLAECFERAFFLVFLFKHIAEAWESCEEGGGDAFQMDTGLCKYKEGKSFLPDVSSPCLFFLSSFPYYFFG